MELDGIPARQGDFVYIGELFVDPGNAKHYRRSTKPELEQLLKAAPDSGVKDETAHFYEAQLLHYGLHRTKDKARAKWRLLDAINANSLAVPLETAATEASLKREYAASKKKSKSGAAPNGPTPASQQAKKKISTSNQKKVTEAEMATLCSPSETKSKSIAASSPASKKRKTASDETKTSKLAKAAKTVQNQKAKETAPKKTGPQSSQVSITNNVYVSGSPSTNSGLTGNHASKQTARCSRGGKAGASSSRPPASPKKATASALQPLSESKPSQSKSTGRDSKPKAKGPTLTTSYATPPLSGLFDIDIMADENPFGASHGLLQLLNYANVDAFSKQYLWGEFNFQYVEGVFKAKPSSIGQEKDSIRLDLEWRGEKRPDGAYVAEPSNIGSVVVNVKGQISGSLQMPVWGTNVHFTGQKRLAEAKEGPKLKERSKGSFETQWRKYKKTESKDALPEQLEHNDTNQIKYEGVKSEQQYEADRYDSEEDKYYDNEHQQDWDEQDRINRGQGYIYDDSDDY